MTPLGVSCPKCHAEHVADLCDGDQGLVSYWGDGSPVAVECDVCGHEFQVREWVERSWEIVSFKAD